MQIHVTSPLVLSVLNASVETPLMVPLIVCAILGLLEIPSPSALVSDIKVDGFLQFMKLGVPGQIITTIYIPCSTVQHSSYSGCHLATRVV